MTSCRKVIDIDLKNSERKLVVNSAFSPEKPIEFNISQSLFILDSKETKFIDGALIEIFENNNLVQILTSSSNGNYISSITPKQGYKYSVYVSYEGLKKAYSENVVPNSIKIISVDTSTIHTTINNDMYEGANNEKYQMKIKFFDNPNEENYYTLSIYSMQETYNYINGQEIIQYENYPIHFSTNDLILQDIDYASEAIFSDELINGKEYELNINFDKYNFYNDSNLVTIYLKSISKDYYLYKSSIQKHMSVNGDPFSEPVQVYNNIINGYGIFAGFSVDTIILNFPSSNSYIYYKE